jgi:hypothetical protein
VPVKKTFDYPSCEICAAKEQIWSSRLEKSCPVNRKALLEDRRQNFWGTLSNAADGDTQIHDIGWISKPEKHTNHKDFNIISYFNKKNLNKKSTSQPLQRMSDFRSFILTGYQVKRFPLFVYHSLSMGNTTGQKTTSYFFIIYSYLCFYFLTQIIFTWCRTIPTKKNHLPTMIFPRLSRPLSRRYCSRCW